MLSRPRGALKYQISPSGFSSSNTGLFAAQPLRTHLFILLSVPPPSPSASRSTALPTAKSQRTSTRHLTILCHCCCLFLCSHSSLQRGFHPQLSLISPNTTAVDALQPLGPLCLLPFLNPTQCHWLVSLQTSKYKSGFLILLSIWPRCYHVAMSATDDSVLNVFSWHSY